MTLSDVVEGDPHVAAHNAERHVINDHDAALLLKAPLASPAFTGTPTGITKAHVGLGNVDNTSDATLLASAGFIEAVQDTVAAFLVQGTNVTITYNDAAGTLTIAAAGGGGGGAVTSVNTKTGVVVLTQDDIADGTTNKAYTATDKTKLAGIATAATANQSDATTNAAIALKAPLASPAFTGTPTGITKTHVGLGNVDNTSDATLISSAGFIEAVQDVVGAMLVQGTNITLTYNDAAGTLTIAASGSGGSVTSVNTKTGVVTLTQDDIGDGTTNKAYSATDKTKLAGIATAATANQSDATTNAAIALKAPIASPTFTGTVSGVTKAMVGLANADNTSDATVLASAASAAASASKSADTITDGTTNKAYTATEQTKLAGVATAATANQSDATTNAAIALKAPLASPAFTGTPTGITKAHVGLGNVDNTSNATERAAAATLTSKRVTPRTTSVATSTSLNLDWDASDVTSITALATSLFIGVTGTPTEGQAMRVRIKDNGTARAISYSSRIKGIGLTLPLVTVPGKVLWLGIIYGNLGDDNYEVVAAAQE